MRRRARGPVLLLLGVGAMLAIVGGVAVFVGVVLADRIYALLPPITADARAIGGAAVALGIACLIGALVHAGFAVALAHAGGRAADALLVPAVVLCAMMAVLAGGWAVAALVSAASGVAPAYAMLPTGIGLLVLAGGYGWSAVVLLRLRRKPRARI
jgi:hypothetical protein